VTETDPARSGSCWEPPSVVDTPAECRTAPVPPGPSDDDPTGQVPPAARRAGRARRGVLAGAGAGRAGGFDRDGDPGGFGAAPPGTGNDDAGGDA
jgi:hypothetical protein